MERFWKGCKPNSVCLACARERIICLSSQYPRPAIPLARDRLERAAPWSPIWPCSGWGLPCLVDCSSSGGLLPHLFTLTADTRPAAVCFLWHCPSKRLEAFRPRVSSAARPCGRCWVTRHRALWSSDFPPRPAEADRSDSPPFQNPTESVARRARGHKYNPVGEMESAGRLSGPRNFLF